jgi:hypothetical protein
MKWGLKPKKKTMQINFPGLSKESILVLAVETAKNLNWSIQWINDSGLQAFTRISSSAGEEILISAEINCVIISSTSRGFQLSDRGRNMENIEVFQNKFVLLTKMLTPASLQQAYELLRKNNWKLNEELISR